ncbi:MAG TPA: hypothetical protein VGB32_08245 [Candidatus Bathyarchaeia archaeon]
MVLMERAVNWTLEELDVEGLERSRVDLGHSALTVIGVRPRRRLGGLELEEVKLFNMEPFAGPEVRYDLGVDLYDVESSWKS